MRTYLFSIYFFLSTGSYAQTDTSAKAFFPHSVGNAWQYAVQGFITPTATLTRDSIAGDTRFLFYNGDSIPAYSIDSALNVVYYPTFSHWRSLRYRLNANVFEWWISDTLSAGGPVIGARVDSVFWGSLFGVPTQMKAIGFYHVQILGDTTLSYWWRNEEYLAAGFGFFLSFYDPPWAPYEQLVGCIIDGRRYGTLVSVRDEGFSPVVPLSSKLYPCFPNPFNPSTTISYFLSDAGKVDVTVYDVLGRKVGNLVDESQDAGFHTAIFQPENLPSSVYFVRLTVRSFTTTTKIIYSK